MARCKRLRLLTVSNQFPTADYAFLSVALPDTHCDMFAPFVPLREAIAGNDVMVVGKGKPRLNRQRDRERLANYERAFEALRQKYMGAA